MGWNVGLLFGFILGCWCLRTYRFRHRYRYRVPHDNLGG
jgi:hypothetical protein